VENCPQHLYTNLHTFFYYKKRLIKYFNTKTLLRCLRARSFFSMNVFDDKHDFIRETHKPFTPLPTVYEERTTKQKWRPRSISKVFIAHPMSSTTKRHFKNCHDDSSTKSTATQNANRHLKNTESTPPHQNTPPKLTHQILSERETPYKVYGNTQVRIPLSTPKSNAHNNYINMKITSHAMKEARKKNEQKTKQFH
jgi:hypothetical protein